MTLINQAIPRDENRIPIQGRYSLLQKKEVEFAGGTTNDMGDYDGTGNPFTLFHITGDVLVNVIALCKESLAGANATIEIGVAGATAALATQITATDLDINEVLDVPILTGEPSIAAYTIDHFHPISGGLDIIQTVGTANITGGKITYYCFWPPLSDDGLVEAV
jgi:hypothetical protein